MHFRKFADQSGGSLEGKKKNILENRVLGEQFDFLMSLYY